MSQIWDRSGIPKTLQKQHPFTPLLSCHFFLATKSRL